jgi:hypothetical protein
VILLQKKTSEFQQLVQVILKRHQLQNRLSLVFFDVTSRVISCYIHSCIKTRANLLII